MILAATRPVLYLSRQYRAGDALPANNPGMVDAWLEAGSAEWTDGAANEELKAKAKPAAEAAGAPGKSNDEFNGEPVGKVPAKGARKKK